jgi:hypothetical protein
MNLAVPPQPPHHNQSNSSNLMADEFDFIRANDRPALLAMSNPAWMDTCKAALNDLGYKVHTAATHGDFQNRYAQIQYEVVIIEEMFAAGSLDENETLRFIQNLPMQQRRHSTVILLGDSFQTFSPMQAFQFSVHATVNSSEMLLLGQLIEKAAADNEAFCRPYNEAKVRLAQSVS